VSDKLFGDSFTNNQNIEHLISLGFALALHLYYTFIDVQLLDIGLQF